MDISACSEARRSMVSGAISGPRSRMTCMVYFQVSNLQCGALWLIIDYLFFIFVVDLIHVHVLTHGGKEKNVWCSVKERESLVHLTHADPLPKWLMHPTTYFPLP